jgi:hypothetical protein
MCVDAMEFVPPEDWPPVLERFRRALRPGGWLYLTLELAPSDRVRTANQAARPSGLRVVDGEVIWDGPDGYYHHYPSMQQVRAWLADAGFAIQEETEGPLAPGGMPIITCWPAWRPRRAEEVRPLALGRPLSRRREQRGTEDNLALDVRGSPEKTAVRTALSPRLLIRMRPEVQVLPGPPPLLTSTNAGRRTRSPLG